MAETSTPLITITVATYRSLPFIERCLQSLRAQTYPNIEIIVVDALNYPEAEQRQCREVIERYAAYVQDGPERSIQRNRGIRDARGEFVLVLDQDMYLTPRVVEACYEKLTSENLVAVNIPEISIGEGYWTKCVALERYVSTVLEEGMNESCRFFRKADVLRVGGYDPAIVGAEDSDLHYRMAALGKIGKIREYINHDEGRTKFWGRVKKKYYYSAAFREYLRRRPAVATAQFFPIKAAYFKHPLVLLRQPLVTLGMFTLRGAEVVAGALGLLFKKG
jgi:glycosyltransferase involved in cell wall biosynthesis